jgi:tRNA A-37 threonylcarbamoyl transferase component Bud32
MDKAFVREFLAGFDDSRYPADFLADYEAMECLSYNDAGETLLVKNRRTGGYDIAKCYTDKSLLSDNAEAKILRSVKHPGLPLFVGEYKNDGMLCVVREYVDGKPLDQYVGQNGITPGETIALAVQLCDILICLHEQKPPVIHRDIKPQNIIIDSVGRAHLIDFGISREFDAEAKADTVCFGTKHFAAPEQYGFAQTDNRADIFSLGVLLGWLLTGECDVQTALPKIADQKIRRVVQKCTAFAPAARYASAAKLKSALLRARGQSRRALRLASAIFACAVCLAAGFLIGRYTAPESAFSATEGVTFEEPLVEQAVRLALHTEEDQLITEKDLLSVTELYIYGDQAADGNEAYNALANRMANNDDSVKNGGLRSLGDLKMFKNLNTLCIALEDIEDIGPLSELTALEHVDLRHNPLTDVSPLASSKALRNLCLFGTRVSDLSALAACPLLENVDAGKTYVTSMAAFSGMDNLRFLYMMGAPLASLDGVEQYDSLEQIGISHVTDGDLSPLKTLPRLKDVKLGEDLRRDAEAALGQVTFTISYS